MKRTTAFIIVIAMLALVSCVSCKTTEPEIVTEYVYIEPEKLDISPDVQLLFDARPNNQEQMQVIPHDLVQTSWQLMWNSNEYFMAWERWEDYATGLEDFLAGLRDNLLNL